MDRYYLIVYKWASTKRTSKTSQLSTRDHCWDALRRETSITRTNQEIHAMMQPTQGWKQEMYAWIDTCYRDSIERM